MLQNMTPNIPATVIYPGQSNQMVMGTTVSPFLFPPTVASLGGMGGVGMGMGMDTTTGTDADSRGLMDGLKLWVSPGSAFTALNRIALGTDKAPITYTVGVALPPLIALGLVLALVSGGRRR